MSAAIPIDDAKLLVDFRQAQKLAKDRNDVATATTGTSITAAFARSFVLLLGESNHIQIIGDNNGQVLT
jgi:hypothetical protein